MMPESSAQIVIRMANAIVSMDIFIHTDVFFDSVGFKCIRFVINWIGWNLLVDILLVYFLQHDVAFLKIIVNSDNIIASIAK